MSELVRSGRLGVVVAATAVLAVAAVLVAGWLTSERSFLAAIPQPAPLFNTPVIPVAPGSTACVSDFTLTPRSDVARFRIGTRRKRAVPITWSVTGRGYRDVGRIAPTWADNDLLRVRIDPPATDLRATMCFRNRGRRPVDFYAASDRTRTAVTTTVDGDRTYANIQLRFEEVGTATIAGRGEEIAAELTAFRAFFVGRWLVWALVVLVVVGIPLAIVWAMWSAAGDQPLAVRRRPRAASGAASPAATSAHATSETTAPQRTEAAS